MNLIEIEWHQLKIAVKQGIEARAQKGGYETHCFKFNSA